MKLKQPDKKKMVSRPSDLPIIIVTGASGFIGRHFLESFHNDFYLYALARRSQKSVGIAMHENIIWVRVDIGEETSVKNTFNRIAKNGGADYILHLAGFYDFDGRDNPEYERTNVNGTRYILESALKLNIKRFIFSSSLTITQFEKSGLIINEKSPADAKFEYAVSKIKGEKLVRQYSDKFPVAIVRLAAIYSDWCEYGPLYKFLSTWLTKRWNSNILAGRGESAVPYLHVKNLNTLFDKIIKKTDILPRYDILIASPDGCTSHKQLYKMAIRYNFGFPKKPLFISKWFAYFGVSLLNFFGGIVGRPPFEKPWMIHYVDLKLNVDASYTRSKLGWQPVARFNISQRLLFLIEHMKSNPFKWHHKNIEAIEKQRKTHRNFKIYEVMQSFQDQIIEGIMLEMYSKKYSDRFLPYKKLKQPLYRERILFVYSMFKTAVRTGDRMHVISYARNLAMERFKEGFAVRDITDAVGFTADFIVKTLLELPELVEQPELKDMEQMIYDEITLTAQLIVDELEDSFDRLMHH
ncbi:MAG: NAD(P)-dependent oxidoreductase [Desulfobacula sp.]|nr:NAD(P)-dependent oxidoreductase [Desulfobacula sp.]